jgi:hypothetical protein
MTTHSNTALPDAVNITRPGYSAMRMVAEWASGVRGEQLYFGFDGTHATLTDVAESSALPVLTRRFTGRPEVKRIYFTVTTPDAPPHTLTIDGRETSALIWGESAVEKFLFPYLASVAGSEVAPLFRKLAHAWYEYPGNDVQVCAVAYECGPSAPFGLRKLTVEGMIALVCLVDGRLERVPLADFAARFPGKGAGPAALEPPVIGFRDEGGWTLTPSVESIVARDAAEFVSGLRGHIVRFREAEGVLEPWVAQDDPDRHLPEPWIEAETQRVRTDRPAPSRVVVQVGHSLGDTDEQVVPSAAASAGDPTNVPDSLFWSDGAVEKLLVPYYGSVKGLGAPLVTTVLLGRWNGLIRRGSPLGACAVLEILQNFLGAPADGSGTAQAVEGDPVDDNPFAVTHLPRSEYIPNNVDEPPTQALEGRTQFLTLGARRESLASFLR